jgi:hypothetical protein
VANSRPTVGRRARVIRARRAALAVAAILTVTAGLALWRANGTAAPRSPVNVARSAGASPPDGTSCGDAATRLDCRDIVVDGRIRRYSLSRASSPTDRTIIIDFGGPGLSTLSAPDLPNFVAVHRTLAAGYNLLILEEPWVTREIPDACRVALTGFYLTVRTFATDASASKAHELASSCQIGAPAHHWGFDRQSYRTEVAAISRKEALRLTGFIGYSFGSVRLSYLAGMPEMSSLEWVSMSHPFPVGVTADELIGSRADATRRLMSELSNPNTVLSPQRPPARSLAVTDFDKLAAMVEVGYLPDANQGQAAADIMSGQRPATVADLSDQLWQRYDANSLSASYLAQLDEMCPGLGRPTGGPAQTIEGVLEAALLPCSGLPGRTVPLKLGATKVCIVLSSSDTVVPGALAEAALRNSSTNIQLLRSGQRSHRSPDLVDSCLPH